MWKARNKVAFKDEVFSLQRIKTSFVFLLLSEMKLFIVDGPLTIAGFVDFVGCELRVSFVHTS